jgi:hypothetical protein
VTPQTSDFGIGLSHSPACIPREEPGDQQSEIAVILEVVHVIGSRSVNVAAHLCAKHATPCRPSILHCGIIISHLAFFYHHFKLESDCKPV